MNSVIDPDKKYTHDHMSVLDKKDLSVCSMGKLPRANQIISTIRTVVRIIANSSCLISN